MNGIETRPLGRTGYQASVLGFGASLTSKRFTNGRNPTVEETSRQFNAVLDAGINYIDTAICYGESEIRLGLGISHRRDEYFLATKCGCRAGMEPADSDRYPHTYVRENIVVGVEQSLKRLNTDHLDLVQLHHGVPLTQLKEEAIIETLQDLQRQGKTRFIGVSSVLPNLTDMLSVGAFDVAEIPYSALEREHSAIITQAAQAGIGTVIRSGLSKGEPGPNCGSADVWSSFDDANLTELLDGMSRVEFMLRYAISHPDLSTTIIGTLNPDHLAENVAAAQKGPLPSDIYEEATRRLELIEQDPSRESHHSYVT